MKRSMLMAKCSPRTPGRWLHGILMSLALSTGPIGEAYASDPAAAPLPGRITLRNGKLTAQIAAVPLRQVLEEVSRLSGARVRWISSQTDEKPVSVGFSALPLPEAFRRILGETNFLLFYTSVGEGTKLTQIWISSKGISGRPPKLIPPPASQRENAGERQAELDTIPVDTLIQTAVSTLDPALRVEAIARLGGYAPADPKVEGILSHLAVYGSNPQVQAAASEVLAGIE